MGNFHFRLALNDRTTAALAEILLGEKKDATARDWLWINAIKPALRTHAEGRKAIHMRGYVLFPNGRRVTEESLSIGPLVSDPEGDVVWSLTERVKTWIEETAGYVHALRLINDQPVEWATPLEWVREVSVGAVATRAAKVEADELDAEEKTMKIGDSKPDGLGGNQ